MVFKIRPLLEPVRELTSRGDAIIGGLVHLAARGPDGSAADASPTAATLVFHAAYLDQARNVQAQFEEFARLPGAVSLEDGQPRFSISGQYEYSAPNDDGPLLSLGYAAGSFENPPAPESSDALLALPPVPSSARFLELALSVEIDGAEEAALDVGDRLDLPLQVCVSVLAISRYFAPGEALWSGSDLSASVEPDVCVLKYDVFDPIARIIAGRVEVARRAAPDEVLATITLTDQQLEDGAHELTWDGRCTEGESAGRLITPMHSPYQLRIVVTTADESVSVVATTEVQVSRVRLDRAPIVDPDAPPEPGSDAHYQMRLAQLGFHAGQVDGDIGDKSKRAIKDFQGAFPGLLPTGVLDDYTKAYLDGRAPPGTGLDHYQFILNALGFCCGPIDGLTPPRRAVQRYREERGLGAGQELDDATKQALDAESLPHLAPREVLEGDHLAEDPLMAPLPLPGAEARVFTYCDGCISPGDLPYRQKHPTEVKNLVRPHFAIRAVPLLRRSDDSDVFSPEAVGPMRIAFRAGIEAPPADLGVSDAVARAYVRDQLSADGDEAATGHHAHQRRGGIRTADDPGTFLEGKGLYPYVAEKAELAYVTECSTEPGPFQGTSGVYFVPSNIAGDRFSVVAKVDAEGFDEAPRARAGRTGVLVNWRRYHASKLWFMEYVPARPHRTELERELGLQPWYQAAYIEFVEPRAPQVEMIRPRNADLNVIDLQLYTAILREAGYAPALLTDAEIQTRFGANILWPLQPAATLAGSEEDYYYAIDSEIMAFEARFSTQLRELSLLEANPGLVTLVFDENAPQAGTMGISAMANPDYQSWAWSVLASKGVLHLIHDQDTSSATAVDGETLAHEFGHALWLHHASTEAGSDPHADDIPEHNPAEYQTCTMSYISLANFCGKCVLKLRGLDETKV